MGPNARLGHAIKRLAHQIRREIDKQVSADLSLDITGLQGHVIGFIRSRGERGDVFQKDVEAEFNIRRSTASGLLRLMEDKGLIVRQSVAHDARMKRLLLTPRAVEMLEAIRREIEKVEARLVAGLTQEEIEAFLSTAAKIGRNLE